MKRTRVCQLFRIIKKSLILAAGIFFVWGISVSHALDPDEILVIANSQMAGSTDLARYYMKKRNIPKERLCSVSVSVHEVISREEYEKAVLIPVRNAVKKLQGKGRIHCLVLFYGMPLKIEQSLSDQRGMRLLKKQLDGASSQKGGDKVAKEDVRHRKSLHIRLIYRSNSRDHPFLQHLQAPDLTGRILEGRTFGTGNMVSDSSLAPCEAVNIATKGILAAIKGSLIAFTRPKKLLPLIEPHRHPLLYQLRSRMNGCIIECIS